MLSLGTSNERNQITDSQTHYSQHKRLKKKKKINNALHENTQDKT